MNAFAYSDEHDALWCKHCAGNAMRTRVGIYKGLSARQVAIFANTCFNMFLPDIEEMFPDMTDLDPRFVTQMVSAPFCEGCGKLLATLEEVTR